MSQLPAKLDRGDLLNLLALALPYVTDGVDDPANDASGKRRAQMIERQIRTALDTGRLPPAD